jgi:hypothetical protein
LISLQFPKFVSPKCPGGLLLAFRLMVRPPDGLDHGERGLDREPAGRRAFWRFVAHGDLGASGRLSST